MAFQPNTDQTLPLVVVVLIAAFSASFSSFIAPFFDLFESRNL
jgi:predicted RND superfamily exporter protein